MKECYIQRIPEAVQVAIADLIPPFQEDVPGWIISRINTPWQSRNRGFGSRLLDRICSDADYERVWLWLQPLATGQEMNGLNQEQLVAWYKKFGFKVSKDFPTYMYRRPGRAK